MAEKVINNEVDPDFKKAVERVSALPLEYWMRVDKDVRKCIKQTFNKKSDKLPLRKDLAPFIEDPFKTSEGKLNDVNWDKKMKVTLNSSAIRELYLEHCFVIYTNDFLTALKSFFKENNIKRIAELACGTGWLSHWMKKYKIPIKASVDNMSWPLYKKRQNFLPNVKKMDAVKYVRENPDIQLFVLSWPYMDTLAYRIWKEMKPGQMLLYIGEGHGGCTANDQFFNETHENKISLKGFSDLEKTFLRFWALHDRPVLYKK